MGKIQVGLLLLTSLLDAIHMQIFMYCTIQKSHQKATGLETIVLLNQKRVH